MEVTQVTQNAFSPSDKAPPAEPVSADRTPNAEAIYTARQQRCATGAQRLERTHVALGYLRLIFGLATLALVWPVFVSHTVPWLWLLLPVIGFGVAARVHQRVLDQRSRFQRGVAFFAHGLARLNDRWVGLRPRTTRLDPSQSLYASDLDLFGGGGLFELLAEARTSLGEDTLAAWLLHPASPSEILERQAAVADLRARLDLREAVASAPGPLTVALDRDALTAWAETAHPVIPDSLMWIAPVLVVLTLAAFARWLLVHSPLLLLPLLLIDVLITFLCTQRCRALFEEAQRAHRSLGLIAALFAAFESESFAAPKLQRLQATLAGGRSASAALRHFAGLSEWIDARANYIVKILDAPLLYSLQLALAVQRWRRQFGPQVRPWLDVLGELEALLSLAGYSYEHPADVFPVLLDDSAACESPLFSAEGLGHPLLPASGCVRNDVAFGEATPLLLISGSNMSGKSTLLRSVGVNAVLAMAGAPVRATSLQMTPVHLAASIQVNDSLQAGRSRFYAEILRLRAIRDAAVAHPPLLFLLDELLAGTNSHDRLAGAEGLIRALLASGAFGLLTTHDLALTGLAPDASGRGSQVRNMHFEDSIVEGELHFDYHLRPGVVERSNGLELMRMIGLDV